MAGPLALLVPIIMTGARVITRVAPKIAKQLLNQGKAKRPDAVIKDLEKAINAKKATGRTAVIKSGSRSVVSGPTKEASKLIKTGQAQKARTVLNSLKKEYGKISKEVEPVVKKATGGQIKKYKGGKQISQAGTKVIPIRSGPTKPLGVGRAIKGWGKGYKK